MMEKFKKRFFNSTKKLILQKVLGLVTNRGQFSIVFTLLGSCDDDTLHVWRHFNLKFKF